VFCRRGLGFLPPVIESFYWENYVVFPNLKAMKSKKPTQHLAPGYPWPEYLLATAAYILALFFIRPTGEFPLNDDWVYAKDIVMTLAAGKPTITGLESAWGIPQLVLGYFLSKSVFSYFTLRMIGIVSTVLAAGALGLLIKDLKFHVRLLILLCFYFFAPLFIVSASFMTDMPFMALWILSLYLFNIWFQKPTYKGLVVACAVSVVATLQRQFGAFLPLTALLILFFTKKADANFGGGTQGLKAKRGSLILLAALVFLPLPISQLWAKAGAGFVPRALPRPNPLRILRDMQGVLFFMSFGFFPLLILKGNVWLGFKDALPVRKNIKTLAGALGCGVVLFTVIRGALGGFMPYFRNQLSKFGLFEHNEVLQGVREPLLDGAFEILFTLIGLFTALSFIGTMLKEKSIPTWPAIKQWVHDYRRKPLQTNEFIYLTCGLCLFYTMIRAGIFDRYMLPAVPAFAIWLGGRINSQAEKRPLVLSYLVFLLIALYPATILFDYFRWNEARWEAAQFAVGQGVEAKRVEAGYEWDGWQRMCAGGTRDTKNEQYVVSFSTLPGFEVWKTFPVASVWRTEAQLILLKRPEGVVVPPSEGCL
jgi:hypothetical protein